MDSYVWQLLCSALWTNRLCGQVSGFAQLSALPSNLGCYLPYFRKGETAHALVLAILGCNQCPGLCVVPIDVEHGPDGFSSPTFLKQNFNGQEAADLYQAVHLHTLEDLAEQGPFISQLALRIITCEYPLEAILAIYFLSATGCLPDKFPFDSGLRRLSGMVTPRLLPLSKLRLNGLMPKLYSLPW